MHGKVEGFCGDLFGLGIAMITGFYFYRSFTSKDGGEENSETIATEQATESGEGKEDSKLSDEDSCDAPKFNKNTKVLDLSQYPLVRMPLTTNRRPTKPDTIQETG
ncbi:hypothetical protein OS493_003254 [Desmophyllum pertusum]|uniref:Uncharacterized protein n=1 Tax=Desmophyllum pertusum TaxID=174260 RepID=A0A9W9YJZ0_9CNID|nr:hypothetical protein OS493_003254 [Desmophyllum pertusum]